MNFSDISLHFSEHVESFDSNKTQKAQLSSQYYAKNVTSFSKGGGNTHTLTCLLVL